MTTKTTDVRVHAIKEAIIPSIEVEGNIFKFANDLLSKAIDAAGDDAPTMDQINNVTKFNSDLEAALIHAAGPIAVQAMKTQTDVDNISGELKIGNEKVRVSTDRTASYNNSAHAKDNSLPEKIHYQGETTTRWSRTGDAALKRARTAVREHAASVLGC